MGSMDILPDINENINNDTGIIPKGKFDYIRLATYIIQAGLLMAFVFGKITFEDLKELLKSI